MRKTATKKEETKPVRVVGYLRVSTDKQELEKNKADILSYGNSNNLFPIEFVEEIMSGKVHWRKRKIADILDSMQSGDAIIVSELSRFGRSMLECMEILSVALSKGVRLFAVKGDWKLDESLQSKIVAMAFSIASEIERDLISQRTTEALRHKKAQGFKLGRPTGKGKSKLDKNAEEIHALLANGSTQKFVAKRYNTTEANLSNWLKKHQKT